MPVLYSSFVPAAGGLNLTSPVITLVSLALFVAAAAYFYRLSLPPQYPTPIPWTIKGGLLFIALVLVLRELTALWSLSRIEVWGDGFWENINTMFDDTQILLMKTFVTLKIVFSIFMIAGSGFLLVLFFKTRDIFPRTFTITLIIQEVLLLADRVATTFLFEVEPESSIGPQLIPHIIRCGVVSLMIWYVTASERSKKTFVLPHHSLISDEDPEFLTDIEEEEKT